MIAQLFNALFGVTAVWLSQDSRIERRKYACIFGLIGQPFWFYAAWTSQQWGIFALCFLYSFSWLRGVRQHWSHTSACLTEYTFSRICLAWMNEAYGGNFRMWRGSGWRFVQVWRVRVSVKWAY